MGGGQGVFRKGHNDLARGPLSHGDSAAFTQPLAHYGSLAGHGLGVDEFYLGGPWEHAFLPGRFDLLYRGQDVGGRKEAVGGKAGIVVVNDSGRTIELVGRGDGLDYAQIDGQGRLFPIPYGLNVVGPLGHLRHARGRTAQLERYDEGVARPQRPEGRRGAEAEEVGIDSLKGYFRGKYATYVLGHLRVVNVPIGRDGRGGNILQNQRMALGGAVEGQRVDRPSERQGGLPTAHGAGREP